jgi:mevalonate pyrophosphate decarboxylase
MDFVHSFNAHFGIRIAYTFDAGPNCCLLLEQQTLPLLESAFKQSFIFNCQFPEIASNGTGWEKNHSL